ncbi:MAG: transporter [Microscillaceae bacterium]|jgi:hypothetical protein|nr:transporter [Microscillaceae bacterium]
MQQYLYKLLIISILHIAFISTSSQAQSLNDGIYLPKQGVCAGLMYSYSSWQQYWEGSLKRENLNLGRVSTQSLQLMVTYGINSKLNLVVGLPYIWTKASAGTLAGQRGVQDLMGGLKYQAFHWQKNQHNLQLSAVVGGSVPLSHYTPDLLPLSIGLQSRTLFGRALVHYRFRDHWLFTAHATYTTRSLVRLDRESYYTTRQIYSNQVAMPNVLSYGLRGGYKTARWSAELMFEQINCLGGLDIRRNDMPFVSNEMDMSNLGFLGTYTFSQLADLQVVAGINHTLAGRNVGQSTAFSLGLMKPFSLVKKTATLSPNE